MWHFFLCPIFCIITQNATHAEPLYGKPQPVTVASANHFLLHFKVDHIYYQSYSKCLVSLSQKILNIRFNSTSNISWSARACHRGDFQWTRSGSGTPGCDKREKAQLKMEDRGWQKAAKMDFNSILRLFRFLDSITQSPDLSGSRASCSLPLPTVNMFHFHHPSGPHQSAWWRPLENLQVYTTHQCQKTFTGPVRP